MPLVAAAGCAVQLSHVTARCQLRVAVLGGGIQDRSGAGRTKQGAATATGGGRAAAQCWDSSRPLGDQPGQVDPLSWDRRVAVVGADAGPPRASGARDAQGGWSRPIPPPDGVARSGDRSPNADSSLRSTSEMTPMVELPVSRSAPTEWLLRGSGRRPLPDALQRRRRPGRGRPLTYGTSETILSTRSSGDRRWVRARAAYNSGVPSRTLRICQLTAACLLRCFRLLPRDVPA